MSTTENTTKALDDHHLTRLRESGVSDEIIASRGYYTEHDPRGLAELGFDRKQRQLVPALVIPVRDITGEVALHRIRPDDPRPNGHRPGRFNKYESPKGSSIVLDIPAFTLERLNDIGVALWYIEGEIKCDAMISQGLATISIPGVWAWKRNGLPLPEFDQIPMLGRELRVPFDSDAQDNINVRRALMSLARYLKGRTGDA